MYVSVIIPTYNREKFIERAVRSVLSQTYRNLEVIVVDDGSSDGTAAVAAKLARTDSRLRCVHHDGNKGAQKARNTGIHEARYDFIAFLDSDNEWLPDKLTRQMGIFEESGKRIGVVYAGYRELHDDTGRDIEYTPRAKGSVYKPSLEQSFAEMNTIVARKDILMIAGLCDERIRAYQEWDLAIRLARFSEFDFVSDALVLYHIHAMPTISSDAMRNAQGYDDVVATHKDAILRLCGPRILGDHYTRIGHHFMVAGATEQAQHFFLLAQKTYPFHSSALLLYTISLMGRHGYTFMRMLKKFLLSDRDAGGSALKRRQIS